MTCRIQGLVWTFLAAMAMNQLTDAATCPTEYANYKKIYTRSYCTTSNAILCIVDGQCKELTAYNTSIITKDSTATDIALFRDSANYLAEIPNLKNALM